MQPMRGHAAEEARCNRGARMHRPTQDSGRKRNMRVKLLSCLASAALLVAASASSALASPASTGAAPETSPIEKVQNDEFSARRGGGHFGGGRMHFGGGGGFKHFGGP